ncbi:MAG: hypothetical protein AAF710_07805 [Planctomycetota bacterium]
MWDDGETAMPDDGDSGAYGRAAVSVWVAAGLWLAVAGCCVLGVAVVGLVPLDEVRQQDTGGQVPPEVWDQLGQAQPVLPAAAAVIGLLTLVPAVVAVVLGFRVRRGGRGATRTCLVLAWIGLAVLGVSLLLSLPTVLRGGVCNVLFTAGLTAVFVWCVVSLHRALQSGPVDLAGYDGSEDPWETRL